MTDLSGVQSALAGGAHDLIDSLLGDLLSRGPNQHTRLLRLHTPLGPDVLLAERARITECIAPHARLPTFAVELLALSTQAHIQPEELLGQPVLLELLTAHSRTELRPFHGHVLCLELLGSDGGYGRYRLQIGSWLDVLRHRTDSWVFQDMSAIDITEAIFADYQGQGALQPAWRWDLKDATVYPRLSTLSQHAETDFDFLQRLWAANGLFCWFEHTGNSADTSSLGQHTLVIADHNGAFCSNAQGRIRFTQAGATMKEDSITRWHGVRRVGVSTLHTASFDYRSVSNHAASADADAAHEQPMPLVHVDQPGAYAFETPEEAARLAQVLQQSLDAQRKRFEGRGTVRTLSPGTSFVLADHADHDLDWQQGGEDRARFVTLSVVHQARNNLSADAKAGLQLLLGHAQLGGERADAKGPTACNGSAEPLYEARFEAQRLRVPVRARLTDEQGRTLHLKPTAWGTQTALVVGLGGPIHTDRDGRIKVQFHWQRGDKASHRQAHPAGSNAPASDASGTWVRVAQDWAGPNWGGVFTPRLGQEVVVAFVEGDIDRPVVIGTAYNGQGSDNAQGNSVAGGAAQATGNAPAWFPGSATQGALQSHAHTAVLSGFKSQSLDASQGGSGAYNQLVFDDSPGQGRVLAHTTQNQTWLQLGHLLQQHDNQRLAQRGYGLELHTQALGALRAGSGLHISSHARAGGTANAQGQPTNTREAQSQLRSHAELLQALSDNAQTQRAKLPNEATPDKLPVQQALQASLQSLKGTSSSTGQDGGHGSIPISDRPDLVFSAAADISSSTQAHTVMSMGQHTTLTSGQDTTLLAQRHSAWAVKDGISLFTRGEAKDGQRAVQDVGMTLHAASGNVNVQAQSDAFTLTAQKSVDIQSTAADIMISAPSRIMLNGGGGYVLIEGSDIEIGTSGNASFLASAKELTGGGSASNKGLRLPQPSELNAPRRYSQTINVAALLGRQASNQTIKADLSYRAYDSTGKLLAQGRLDTHGNTQPIYTDRPEKIRIALGDGAWIRSADANHGSV